jgi:hypothetical protein
LHWIAIRHGCRQGCQMAFIQTKNKNLGKFWRDLQWKILVYFKAIWYILRSFNIFYGHLVYLEVIWYIFHRFGMLYQEQSGNPGCHNCLKHLVQRFNFYCVIRSQSQE